MKNGQEIFAVHLHIKCLPELRQLIEAEARRNSQDTMNDVIVRVLAQHYKKPELGRTPRKRMGRPPGVRKAVPA